jgi:hypothetical protein
VGAAAPSASSPARGRGAPGGGRAGATGPSASSPVRGRSGRTHSPRCVAGVAREKRMSGGGHPREEIRL